MLHAVLRPGSCRSQSCNGTRRQLPVLRCSTRRRHEDAMQRSVLHGALPVALGAAMQRSPTALGAAVQRLVLQWSARQLLPVLRCSARRRLPVLHWSASWWLRMQLCRQRRVASLLRLEDIESGGLAGAMQRRTSICVVDLFKGWDERIGRLATRLISPENQSVDASQPQITSYLFRR